MGRIDRGGVVPVQPMFHRLGVGVFLFVSVLVAAAPDAAAQPAPGGSLIALAQNLKVEVTETGPEQLWTLHLSNGGDFPIGLVADPGLLWFQVQVPGRSTPQTCRLPEPLWPKTMRRRAKLVLSPGQRFSRRFDARFFCFADLTKTVLVPGARVEPFFGWPLETREVRVKGKRTTETLPPRAPFVAWALPAPEKTDGDATEGSTESGPPTEGSELDGGEGLGSYDNAEPAPPPPAEGVKHISGATFVLSPAYARWSQPLPELSPSLHTLMLAGSDAEDERNVTITVSVLNASNVPQQIFVRRELVSYDVTGPDGTFHCPTTDLGAPDIASFTTLAPQRSERFVVRLIEMCPRGSFSRPGLYEVHGSLEAKHGGQAVGFDAFVGTLPAPRPALVRVRSGDRSSFLRPTPMLAGAQAPGGTAAGPAGRGAPPMSGPENDAPAEGSPDAPPQEELPPDPGGALPEEAPAPQSPTDGTVVE